MTDTKDNSPDLRDLRRRAEERLETEALAPEDLSPAAAARLIHELQVHQIELELQNEELRQAQVQLAESRDRYVDLYDFAPVGYLTLDSKGKIVEANLTAATMLGLERSRLLEHFFPLFLVEADRRHFRQMLDNSLHQSEWRGEFRLQDGNGNPRVVLLDLLFVKDAQGRDRSRLTLTDVTELKQAQEEARLHKENLEELVVERTAELLNANRELQNEIATRVRAEEELHLALGDSRRQEREVGALLAASREVMVHRTYAGSAQAIFQACRELIGAPAGYISLLSKDGAENEVVFLESGGLPCSVPPDTPMPIRGLRAEAYRTGRVLYDNQFAHSDHVKFLPEGHTPLNSVLFAPLLIKGQAVGLLGLGNKPGGFTDNDARLAAGFAELAAIALVNKRAEEALDTQARILESMAEAVTVTDSRGHITYTNPAFDAMFGYKPGELLGRHSNILNFYPPEENTRMVKEILRRVNEAGVWSGEFRNCKKDGRPFYTAARISALEVHGKKLYISVQGDITERKRSEKALRQAKEEWERTFDAVVDYIAILDKDHHIIRMNRAMAELLGRDAEKALGLPCYKAVHGLDEPPDFCPHTRVVATGREQFEEVHEFGRIFAVNVSPLFSSDHELMGSVHVARDITEEKLAQEEIRRLASFPELNPHPVLEVDRRGRVVYANPAARHAAEKLGLPQGVKAFLPPNLKKFFAAAGQDGPRQHAFDLDFGTAAYAVALYLPHDLPTARLYALDITQRRSAEKELQESEARFRSLFESMGEGVVLHEMIYDDRGAAVDYRILAVNHAYTVHTGLKPKKIVGRLASQAYGTGEPPYLETCARVAETGESLTFETYFPPLKRYFSVSVSSSQPGRFFSVFEDITERRQTEAALRESEERYRSLFENNHAVMLLIDPESGDLVDANPAALAYYGYSREELLALKITNLNVLDPQEVFREMQRAKSEERQHFEFRHRLASGAIRDVEVFSGPIRIKGRELLYSIVHDDTARKQAEAALRRAHDELEERVEERTAALRLSNEQLLWEMEERQDAEDKLRASEARFTAFMKHLPGLAVMRDVEGRYLFANEAWEQVTGRSKKDWQGKLLEEIWPVKQAAKYHQLDQQVLLAGEPLEALEPLEMSDGFHYFLCYRFPIQDKDGLPYMVGAINIDITGRIKAEEEARQKTRLFEAFFDNAISPLVFLDPQFNFIRVNQAYARSCHRTVSDFAGRNHFDLYPSEAKLIFEEVVRTKIPCVASARPFTYPDHPEWGVTYWDWSLVPILDEAGEVDFLVFSLKDVTEQVQAEEERRRLVEILENTPDFVGIADFYGNLQYLNRAGRTMVGVGLDEDVTNLKVLQMHPHWVGEMILAEGSPTARKKGAWQMESALLHRDGREIPVSQVILAHKESTGRVQFFSTIARDITDLKEAQENILRQANILNGINTIFREALTSETEQDLGRTCLAVAEDLTASRFGFIDELNEQGTLDALAFSDPGWETCRLHPVKDLAHLKNVKPVGLLGKSVQEGRPLIANDPASHPGAAGLPEGHPPLTAYLGVPLRLGGQTIGLIGLGNKPGGYTAADQEAVETLAPSIVEALSHYRSKEALKKSERRLRHLADQLLTAQEDERKRLAAELHDELGHALLTLKLAFSAIAKNLSPRQKAVKLKIQEQLDFINEVIEEVRRLYHHLSPGDVEDLGLSRALETLIEDFALYRPHITWKVDLPDLNGLFSLPVQTIIYRIIQEALTNIGKHANPEHVTVLAWKEDARVHFRIQDDGAGFDVALLESASGVGLAAMEERLNMIGGSFTVSSTKETGTEISFSIPTLPEDERS